MSNQFLKGIPTDRFFSNPFTSVGFTCQSSEGVHEGSVESILCIFVTRSDRHRIMPIKMYDSGLLHTNSLVQRPIFNLLECFLRETFSCMLGAICNRYVELGARNL